MMHVKKCGQAVGPDPDISILEDFMTEQLYEHENHELARTASDRIEEFLIAPQYLLAKFPVVFLLKPNRCLLGNNVIHWTCPLPNRLSNFLVSAWQRSNSLRIGKNTRKSLSQEFSARNQEYVFCGPKKEQGINRDCFLLKAPSRKASTSKA
jgi:hypothetical protein